MTGQSASQGEGARLVKQAGTVASFTLLSRVLGYVRDAVMAHVFGAGIALDAFIAAQTIPYVLRRLVAEGSLMIALVPLLSAERAQGGAAAMRRFTGGVLGLLIPLLLALTGLGMAFPDVAVKMFAAGFDAPRAELAADLTRIMMPFLVFISLTAVAGGLLNVVGIFAPTAAAPILLNIAIICGALFARGFLDVPVRSVAWGLFAGGILQLLLQIPFLMKERLLVWPSWEPRHPSVILLLRRMLPAVFGVAVYQLNMIIIRQIASYLPHGQLSCYFWASRLEEFALGVFAVSISIAALPTMSEHAARGDKKALFATFRRALKATNFITIPSMVTLLVLAEPIVGVLFRHGEFTAEDGELTTTLVRLMALALLPVGAIRVIVPSYYAIGDTRTPVIAATASMVSTAAFGIVLGDMYEIAGLTVATIIAGAVQLVVLAVLFRRQVAKAMETVVGVAEPKPAAPTAKRPLTVASHGLRSLIAVIPGGALGAFLSSQRYWFGGDNWIGAVYLTGLMALTGGLYLLAARLLQLPEVDLLIGFVLRRLRRA